MTAQEVAKRGWEEVDVVFVTGDAYVDHPSFAMALLGRTLEAAGFRVAILSQPDWRSCEDWKCFGRPRLFFAISAGNMDSMINHYTANRKVRNADAYSAGGQIGRRPDRSTLAYCQRAREAYKGVPVIAGGVEASLRRLAHYDFWSDKVRRSILLDCKADLLGFGMGEAVLLEMARRLKAGEKVRDLRDMRGVAYLLGASETPPEDCLEIPSYEEVRENKLAFADATRIIHQETNPYNAKRLSQRHGRRYVVCNPPGLPLSTAEMDAIYRLPFTRKPHPSYSQPIPSYEMIKDSVTIMRGCFGGCTFCSITTHQGRIIQSRSQKSVLSEVQKIGRNPAFKGTISDIGGPTANMYQMTCSKPEVEVRCRRQSCVFPTICRLLVTCHKPLIQVMKQARETSGVKKVLVASGVRMDLALRSPEYIRDLTHHHVGGLLKVAPEHSDPEVLARMRKPGIEGFEKFARIFQKENRHSGKKQYLVPYFISSHPGSDLKAMIELAVFLKQGGYRPDQVQDFIPAPFDVATAMYYTGLNPFSKKPVQVARSIRDRRLQRSLLQFFKPENYFAVREALLEAGRQDLIGSGCEALIPSEPPREALLARRREAERSLRGGSGKGASGKRSRPPGGAGYRPRGASPDEKVASGSKGPKKRKRTRRSRPKGKLRP
jgi:uncharacterized radical SAM protein YgiQ